MPAITVKSSAATITGRPSMRPEPMHDGVGRGLLATHERAELEERARVEQVVDAGAGVELALAAVLGQPLLAAHRARRGPPLLEVGDGAVPALRSVELELGHRHRPVKLAGRRSM